MTAHGFQAMASTQLNELGWPSDVIERQLAHTERNRVRAAHNRAQYLADRRRMMQARQYNGGNNGDLSAAPKILKARGWRPATVTAALKELVHMAC